MPAAAVAIIGAGLSYAQASQAQKNAKEASEKQAKEMGFASAEAKRQYDEQQAMYKPAKEKLMNEAMAETPSDYDKYADIVRRQYDQTLRRLGGGNTANSGLASSQMIGAELNKASDLAGAYTQAKDKQRNLTMQLLGHDRSAQTGATYLDSIYKDADYQGDQARAFGEAAAKNYGDFKTGVLGIAGGLGKAYSAWQEGKKPPKINPPTSNPSSSLYDIRSPGEPEFMDPNYEFSYPDYSKNNRRD